MVYLQDCSRFLSYHTIWQTTDYWYIFPSRRDRGVSELNRLSRLLDLIERMELQLTCNFHLPRNWILRATQFHL